MNTVPYTITPESDTHITILNLSAYIQGEGEMGLIAVGTNLQTAEQDLFMQCKSLEEHFGSQVNFY